MSVNTYIQGHDASTLKSHQSRTAEKQADYLIPHIQPNFHILDVGCGPGTITCGLAKYAAEGQVTGLDYSEEVLEQARKEASGQGLTNVSFQTGEAHHLPFPDDSFDVVHCHAVLIHLPDAAAAVREMRRVCKPGRYVAAREPDWVTCVIHPYSEVLERWKEVHMKLKQNEGAEPNAGRRLLEWAVRAGFDPARIQITSDVLQYAGKEEVMWWGELYAARMSTEFGQRAVQSGVATAEEVGSFKQAYLDWSKSEIGFWGMMHMKLLCQK